jgi:F-type H+-transporting ATPase subunit gamma
MAKGRELKGRIKSVENTRKITRTMEMVATSKMKRAHDRVVAARPYAHALADVISSLYSPDLAERFPLLRQPSGPAKRAAIVVLTGNRGLAGAFNSNVIKEARGLIAKLEGQGTELSVHAVGKKGIGYFRYVGRAVASSRTDIGDQPTGQHAAELVDALMQEFAAGHLDAVYIVYARFVSALSTLPTSERVLPVTPPEKKEGKQGPAPDYLLYPSAEAILEKLLPAYVRNAVYRALVETIAGFYSSQRTAMKNATDNAGDMLNALRRTYNRARQAQITQEIAEIVGGSAALEG